MKNKTTQKALLYFEIFLLVLYALIDLGLLSGIFFSDSVLSAIGWRLTIWPLNLASLGMYALLIYAIYNLFILSFPVISLIKNNKKYIYMDILLIILIGLNIYFFISILTGFKNLG